MVIGKYRITPRGYVVFGSTGIILLVIIAMLMTQIAAPPSDVTQGDAISGSEQTQGSTNGTEAPAGTNTAPGTTGSGNASGTTQNTTQVNAGASLSKEETNKILQSLRVTVYFKPDEYVLSEAFYGQMDKVVEMSKRFKEAKIILDGHFNGVPGERTTEFRVSLAQNRAEMVEAYLISQGVEPNRVIINNLGCTKPVNKDDSWQEIEKNRRVDIYFKSL